MGFTKSATTSVLLVTASLTALTGCASRMSRPNQEGQEEQQAPKPQAALQTPTHSENIAPSTPPPAAEPTENPRASELGMSARLNAMEAKLAAMNDKLDATRASLDNFLSARPLPAKPTGVSSQAAETVGTPVASKPLATDVESGFVNDPAVQQYRKGQILLESQKYADSILAFSGFLEKFPDHPLAGSAQFHVGEAYAKQREWKLAEQELQKVLTSYDRSIHVADTLRVIAEAEDHLGKSLEAARHRQQLSSLFANSPAAVQAAATPAQPADAVPAAAHQEKAPAPAVKPAGEGKPSLDGPPPTAPVTAPETAPASTAEKTSSE